MARILSLTRLPGTLGDPVDAIVISNAKTLGEWKADQECFRSEITKGENAIQIEIKGVDGKRYLERAFHKQQERHCGHLPNVRDENQPRARKEVKDINNGRTTNST